MIGKFLSISVLFACLAGVSQAQAVRLDARSSSPRLSQRINDEKLTAAETRFKAEKLNAEQALSRAKASVTSKATKKAAVRSQQFSTKKKKRNVIDRDD